VIKLNAPVLIIEIANEQSLSFDELPLLEVTRMIVEDHGFHQGEISIAIVDDPTMKTLNKRYLDHDYETDVLSFVLDVDEEVGLLNGQLVASAETANRIATELNVALDDELLLYVVHGTLHLVGLRDKAPEETTRMRVAEAHYLARYGVEHRCLDEPDDNPDELTKEQN